MSSTLIPHDLTDQKEARVAGCRLGLRGGAVFAGLAIGAWGMIGVLLTIPILVAAGTGGWLVGPQATIATARGEWVSIVLGLAGWAVFAGSMTVGAGLGVVVAFNAAHGPVDFIGIAVVAALGAGVAGSFGAGAFAFPFTVLGATIWAVLMRRGRSS